MSTVLNIVDDIRDKLRNHNDTSQDSDLSEEAIVQTINDFRAAYLRREINKNNTSLRSYETDLGCVTLESADQSECSAFPSGCTVLRTACTLPRFVRRHRKEAITFVGDINKIRRIVMDQVHNIQFNEYNKYTSGEIKAYYLNDRIYITCDKVMEAINIRGVVEDPTNLGCVSGSDGCFNFREDEYPVPRDLVPQIKEDVVNFYVNPGEKTVEDIVNNRRDSNDAQA